MDIEFSQLKDEMARTIVQSSNIEEYEADYEETVKNYAEWISEMVGSYAREKHK